MRICWPWTPKTASSIGSAIRRQVCRTCFASRSLGQPAVFMRRSALDASGGLDPSFHLLLDHQLWIKAARHAPMLHVDEIWAAARYHPAAKNRRLALEFGGEAFRLLNWAKAQPDLSAALSPVARRAHASAHRLNARYLLDGGRPAAALAAWTRALLLHPPVALAPEHPCFCPVGPVRAGFSAGFAPGARRSAGCSKKYHCEWILTGRVFFSPVQEL